MYQSPGAPYQNDYYRRLLAQRQERTEIRKATNRTAWTVFIGILLMVRILPAIGLIIINAPSLPPSRITTRSSPLRG